MRKRVWLAAGGSLLAATIGLFGAAAAASASTTSPVVGYTYVNDNTAVANTIAGFDRHADGSLTPIPGSPFAAGGAGLGAGLASQGAIQVTSDGRYLLAVDAGSNQISVLRVTADGVPVLVGQPVSSGGVQPVKHRGLTDGPGLRRELRHGRQRLLRLPAESGRHADPDPALDGHRPRWFGPRRRVLQPHRRPPRRRPDWHLEIDSFVVLPSGRLFAAPGSPFTGQGLGQLGAEFSPVKPWQLFVSNAHNGACSAPCPRTATASSVSSTSIGSSPYADGQTAPCWVEISHDGRYLFTVNTGSGNISSYSINPDGSLALIGSSAITGGGADIDARLSPDGKYLLVTGWPQLRVRVRRQRRQPHRAGQLTDPAARRGQLIGDCEHLRTTGQLSASVPGSSAARARER